jgi:hypothetical protein
MKSGRRRGPKEERLTIVGTGVSVGSASTQPCRTALGSGLTMLTCSAANHYSMRMGTTSSAEEAAIKSGSTAAVRGDRRRSLSGRTRFAYSGR